MRESLKERQRVGRELVPHSPEECEETRCLNCGHTFRGRYCPSCGQKSDTQRFAMKSVLQYLLITFTGGDSILLHSCGNLLYCPGFMVRDFLCGKRVHYTRPLQLLAFVLMALYLFLAILIGSIVAVFSKSMCNNLILRELRTPFPN